MPYLPQMFDDEININVLCAWCVRQIIGARLGKCELDTASWQ